MSTLEHAADGRFVAQSFTEKYPTGRKHCGRCKCWRHVIDFSPATWVDAAKTIPLKLVSYCRVCVSAQARQRTGYKLRHVFDGQVGTPSWHARRLFKRRQRYRRLREDPVWVQDRRDYANHRNRMRAYAKWAPDPALNAKASGGERFLAARFVAYLDRWLIELEVLGGSTENYLNGFPLTDTESRTIWRWRNGETEHLQLATADRWSVRFDLPFWEIEEAVVA